MLTIQLTEKTKSLISNLIEDDYHDEDMFDFIEQYGEIYFQKYYVDYVKIGEEYSYAAIEAFIDQFGIQSISGFEDSYYGEMSIEDFVKDLIEQYSYPSVPDWIEYDLLSTWDNLEKRDFAYNMGFIFSKNFF